jgi:hypothetical protein
MRGARAAAVQHKQQPAAATASAATQQDSAALQHSDPGQARSPDEAPVGPEEPLPDHYTAAELAEFAAQQDCPVELFARRWIIQRSDSFYVYCAGRYLSPIRKMDLDVSLPRDLSPAPIEWLTYKANGETRSKTTAELLRDYATVARDVVADLAIHVSKYDEASQTFVEAAAPPRPLTPRYHAQIDEWITLLGGQDADVLRAWLATLLRLDRQSCALYLSGPPGSGKGMLALGASRLWSVGGFTELGRVLDNFNSDLLRCPLVVADEHIPGGVNRRATAELRTMPAAHRADAIAEASRRLLPTGERTGRCAWTDS